MITNRYKRDSRRLPLVLVTLILASLLSACVGISQEASMPTPEPGAEAPIGMPNPASLFCEEQGGRLEIRSEAGGGQYGVCIFADGSECEEWAFYRGECQSGQPATEAPVGLPNPASVFCEEQGGRLEIRSEAGGGQYGVCIFTDGSECEEWAFYRGECTPGQPAAAATPALPGVPAPDVAVEEILAQVQLPANAYSGDPAVLSLRTPEDSPPLWAMYSTGMRNYDLDPVPSHFLAILTRNDSGWQELARIDLDEPPADDVLLVEPLPDYIDPSGVQQVAIEPSRVWLTVDGGAGAHSGTYQVLSFDGQALSLELASSAASPGAGFIADVNQDGQNDVVFNTTEPYIFCYACGVRHPYFQVHTWLGDALVPVEISPLMMGQRGTPTDEANSAAVAYAQAGLWHDALAKVDEAVTLAGDDDPATPAGSLRWNQALIRLNHDAHVQAVHDSAYPLLSQVFYGDYAAAVDLMRPYAVEQIFSADTPLVVGTAAEGWEPELSGYLLSSADAALAVQPDLAPAWFMRAWARYLADPASPLFTSDLTRAAELAPDDALFTAAAAELPAPALSSALGEAPPTRLGFAAGASAATVPGSLLAGEVQRYVLAALQGQTMAVNVVSPNQDVALAIWGEDGAVLLSDDAGATQWRGVLPATQDYSIGLSGAGAPTFYQLSVSIPPLGQ